MSKNVLLLLGELAHHGQYEFSLFRTQTFIELRQLATQNTRTGRGYT